MNTISRLAISTLFVLGVSLPAAAQDDNLCEQIEGWSQRENRDIDFDFDSDDLIVRDDGRKALVITEEHDVIYYGDKLELSEEGRRLAGTYYHAFDAIVDEAMDIAGDAAGLGISAATSALLAVFTGGDLDDMEARIEEKAKAIEARAEGICTHFETIRDTEFAMAEEIQGFQPVLFQQD